MLKEFSNDTSVVHCQKEPYDIYIGRPSDWGNPFTHIRDRKTKAEFIVKSRDEAVQKYKEWIVNQDHLMKRLEELRGKKLGCWCSPKKCHGEVLIELLREQNV